MTVFGLILLLALAVLLSAVLERLIPRVSIPLIQIALGVVIAIVATEPIDVTFNPDFFLLLFIAPMLFNDAKLADKLGLWRNRKLIISLAVGLVIGLALAVGFAVHAIIPSISLAAAFALGGALGPTDAAAVIALRGSVELEQKERSLLSGEALINDASGVVAFQFAIAAAVTGSFSVTQASITFLVDFFGGIAAGLVLGWLANLIREKVDNVGLDSNTFHVLFDITLPFIIYLVAELFHVSGILAVVAAGLIISAYNDRRIGPVSSRLNIVSANVWSVLTFALNGIVFVLLGIQLPKAMTTSWENVTISNFTLIGMVLLITTILVVVRFLWVLFSDALIKEPGSKVRRGFTRDVARSALVTTIGGPKGAVTLSVIFSTPLLLASGAPFPQRNLIIFLASGVILCTLLLANFILPILAPKTVRSQAHREARARAQVDVLRRVIERLADTRDKENSPEVTAVIKSYNERIEWLHNRADIEGQSATKLRLELNTHLQEFLIGQMEHGSIDDAEGYQFLRRLVKSQNYLNHRSDSIFDVVRAFRHTSTRWRVFRRTFLRWRERISGNEDVSGRRDTQVLLDRESIAFLQQKLEEGSTYPAEVITRVQNSYMRSLQAINDTNPSITAYARTSNKMDDIARLAYRYELEEIRDAAEREDITRDTAKLMRDNVYLMLVDLDEGLEPIH